jgi:116 kDa U5 small nuclear ribonucleoprotein component
MLTHHIAQVYADIEVNVADPIVTLSETVIESTIKKCFARTPNGKCKLTVVAEPLPRGLAEALEAGAAPWAADARARRRWFHHGGDWLDELDAANVWAAGPGAADGPNLFVDDTACGLDELPDAERAAAEAALQQARPLIVQGFRWATREVRCVLGCVAKPAQPLSLSVALVRPHTHTQSRIPTDSPSRPQGPLCEEPVRGVKFKLIDFTLPPAAADRGAAQLIPTVRRVCYCAMLLAAPRLMEPVFLTEVQCPPDTLPQLRELLGRRRYVAAPSVCPLPLSC